MGDSIKACAEQDELNNSPEYLKKRVKELESKLWEAEAELSVVKERQRVLPYAPSSESISRGFAIGATVKLSSGASGVVVAYDSEGDPIVQGPQVSESGSAEAAFATSLELILPPKKGK